MRNDYLSLAMCVLLVWAAAYLPVAIVAFVYPLPWIYYIAQICLVMGTALSVLTSMGTTLGYALGVAVGAWVVAVLALFLFDVVGPMRGYLASPFLLYYGYSLFRSDFSALGDGLRTDPRADVRLHLRGRVRPTGEARKRGAIDPTVLFELSIPHPRQNVRLLLPC